MNINKKIFEFYYHCYEDYEPHLLYHENKTRAQFKKDCIFITRKYADNYIKRNSLVGMDGLIKYAAKKMKELGYVPIKPHHYGVFSGFYLNHEDRNNEAYLELLGEELLEKAIIKNNIDDDEQL